MTKRKDPQGSDRTKQPAPLAVPAPSSAASSAPCSKPVILVDYEKYAHFLDDADLSDEEKQEFVQTIWSIIVEFVSLGFGVHPLQQAQNHRENNEKSLPEDLSDVITWCHSQQDNNDDDRLRRHDARDRECEES